MGKQGKQWLTLIFWAPKLLQMLTAAMILKDTPWKESYDPSRQHIKKPRHYFVNKVPPSQAMVFPVVMNGCESWTIKKAFELWSWRRLLRVPWTARRSNQFILKEINPEFTLEGLMLKLKLQTFGHYVKN